MKAKLFYLVAAMVIAVAAFGAGPAAADSFLFQSPTYTLDQVSGLSIEQLRENYIGVTIDIEAAKIFGVSAGLTAPDFLKLKALLRYRIELIQEFDRRGIEIPRVEP